MAERLVIELPSSERTEIAGVTAELERQLAAQRTSLMHLDATLLLSDPNANPAAIVPRGIPKGGVFDAGEITAMCMAAKTFRLAILLSLLSPVVAQGREQSIEPGYRGPEFPAVASPSPSVVNPQANSQQNRESAQGAQTAQSDQRGTEQFPLVVKIVEAPKANDEHNTGPDRQPSGQTRRNGFGADVWHVANELSTSDWVIGWLWARSSSLPFSPVR